MNWIQHCIMSMNLGEMGFLHEKFYSRLRKSKEMETNRFECDSVLETILYFGSFTNHIKSIPLSFQFWLSNISMIQSLLCIPIATTLMHNLIIFQ